MADVIIRKKKVKVKKVKKPGQVKKIPDHLLRLDVTKNLILIKCPDTKYESLFKRYEVLFEGLANLTPDDRRMKYMLLLGLILSSHAKLTKDEAERKKLFDMKNELYLKIVNNKDHRRRLGLLYLMAKPFKVVEYCPRCIGKNKAENLKPFQWKFCRKCKIDRAYYNVLSMHHKFDKGSASMFLGNDQIHRVEFFRIGKKGKLDQFEEEFGFLHYHYRPQHLRPINLEDALKMYQMLMG